MDQDSVGAHCELSSCRQRDFLPFRCDVCDKLYCLTHRSYREHDCAAAGSKDHRAIVCPLCAQSINFVDGEDVNRRFEQHCATECAPESRAGRVRKPRCPAVGCREKLVTSNTAICGTCRKQFCLAHRYVDAHTCSSPIASSFLGRFSRSAGGAAGRSGAAATPTAAPPTGGGGSAPCSVPAVTAAVPRVSSAEFLKNTASVRRRSPGPAAPRVGAGDAPPQSAPVDSAAPAPTIPDASPEICYQCRERFASLVDLIEHAERVHAGAAPTAASALSSAAHNDDATACPQCSRVFSDVHALIRHVEASHSMPAPRQEEVPTCALT